MTALEILKSARVIVADQWEWDKWEERRAAEKAKTVGENVPSLVTWAVWKCGAGEMGEYGKALAAVKGVMGDVEKWQGGWKETVAALDRVILSEQARAK